MATKEIKSGLKCVRIFTVTENGFSITNNNVAVPACRIKAKSFLEANELLSEFLKTILKPDEIELITPIERIDFE